MLATQGLAAHADRAEALARALADAAPTRALAAAPLRTGTSVRPGSAGDDAAALGEAWRGLDALLRDPEALVPREGQGRRDVLLAAVLGPDGRPLALVDRRGVVAAPLAPLPLGSVSAHEALDLLDLGGRAALVATRGVGTGPGQRLVVVVCLDAEADLAAIARAAQAEASGPATSWALLDGPRLLAGGLADGAPPLAAPAGRSGTVVVAEGQAERFETALPVTGIGPTTWRLLARAPAGAPPEPLERLVLGLAVVVPVIIVALALGWRREAEARERGLRERERFLAAVVDAIGDALVVIDRELVVRRANAAAERRLGPVVGKAYAQVVAARRATPGAEAEAVRAVLERGRARVDDAQEPASRTSWQVVRFPIVDPDGLVTGVVELARDVTDTRRLQAQLIQSEKLSTLGEMAAGIAHEVNNPVGVVSMFAQLAQEDVKAALGEEHPALEKLRTIEEQASAIGDIVKGLLRFSRKSEGVRARLDVRQAIERALSIVAHQKAHAGVTVERALDLDPPPEVLGDEGQLAQVVLNLVVNASHAMKGQGTLRVSVARRGEADPYPPGRPFGEVTGSAARVEVRVADSGHGIPPEVLEHLFEPFFTTKPTGEGTGLGLSVSFAIVRDHGGCMWVASEPGQGTTFTVDLPAAPPV